MFLTLLVVVLVVDCGDVLDFRGKKNWSFHEADLLSGQALLDAAEGPSASYPSARMHAFLVHVPGTADLLLLGGNSGLSDTWLYHTGADDLGAWELLAGAGGPGIRATRGAASEVSGYVFIFGGDDGGRDAYIRVFDHSTSTWSEGTYAWQADLWNYCLWKKKGVDGFYADGGPWGSQSSLRHFVFTDVTATPPTGSFQSSIVVSNFPSPARWDSAHWTDYSGTRERLWRFGGYASWTTYGDLRYIDIAISTSYVTVYDYGEWVYPDYTGPTYGFGSRDNLGDNVVVIEGRAWLFGGDYYDNIGRTYQIPSLWMFDMDEVSVGTDDGMTWIQMDDSDGVDRTSLPVVRDYSVGGTFPGSRSGVATAFVGTTLWLFGGHSNSLGGEFADLWSTDVGYWSDVPTCRNEGDFLGLVGGTVMSQACPSGCSPGLGSCFGQYDIGADCSETVCVSGSLITCDTGEGKIVSVDPCPYGCEDDSPICYQQCEVGADCASGTFCEGEDLCSCLGSVVDAVTTCTHGCDSDECSSDPGSDPDPDPDAGSGSTAMVVGIAVGGSVTVVGILLGIVAIVTVIVCLRRRKIGPGSAVGIRQEMHEQGKEGK